MRKQTCTPPEGEAEPSRGGERNSRNDFAAKDGNSIRKNFKEDTVYMDREGQIQAIQKTFAESLVPIETHYSKPNVTPVEILPVFPDIQGWNNSCAHVMFDQSPAPTGRSVPAQIEEMSQAMILGLTVKSGEQFVGYFLPTQETLVKQRNDHNNIAYEEDDLHEYKMTREYHWDVKNNASKGYEENYFLVVREDGVYYNALEFQVRLNEWRQKPIQGLSNMSNTRLVVKSRPFSSSPAGSLRGSPEANLCLYRVIPDVGSNRSGSGSPASPARRKSGSADSESTKIASSNSSAGGDK